MSVTVKQHESVFNGSAGHRSKLVMRQNILQEFGSRSAHVFEAFCGRGAMWEGAWSRAATYVGCDKSYTQGDKRRRFVGDNRRVMRCIDLQPYNVFDFDAFGSPWEQVTILLARRSWAKDELGAIVLTDGSGFNAMMGGTSGALALLIGLDKSRGFGSSAESAQILFGMGLGSFFTQARVKPLRIWRSEGRGGTSGRGNFLMQYAAAVFRGLG